MSVFAKHERVGLKTIHKALGNKIFILKRNEEGKLVEDVEIRGVWSRMSEKKFVGSSETIRFDQDVLAVSKESLRSRGDVLKEGVFLKIDGKTYKIEAVDSSGDDVLNCLLQK